MTTMESIVRNLDDTKTLRGYYKTLLREVLEDPKPGPDIIKLQVIQNELILRAIESKPARVTIF